jgi:type II secretory pathway pseudopilin PulG
LAAPTTESQQSYNYGQPWTAGSDNYGQRKKGLAVASLLLGIIGFFTLGIVGIGAIVGIILATVALKRASSQPAEYGGTGIAVGGLVTNILSLVMLVPVALIAAIAIPNLLAARRAANEGRAVQTVKTIAESEEGYRTRHGHYGSLDELVADQLMLSPSGKGVDFGYRYRVDLHGLSGNDSFEVTATPTNYPNSATRSFFMAEDRVLRGGDKHGTEASAFDPPLTFQDSIRQKIKRDPTPDGFNRDTMRPEEEN